MTQSDTRFSTQVLSYGVIGMSFSKILNRLRFLLKFANDAYMTQNHELKRSEVRFSSSHVHTHTFTHM